MTEREIILNTIAQLENLKVSVHNQNFATKSEELALELSGEIEKINAAFEAAQATLVEKRNNAIAEKKALYSTSAEVFAEKAVAGINALIAEQKKLLPAEA